LVSFCYILSELYLSINTLELPPPFLAKALAGGSAPINAGGDLLPIDILLTLVALYSQFVGEDFNLSATVRAFM
jgi:hypothetical protein